MPDTTQGKTTTKRKRPSVHPAFKELSLEGMWREAGSIKHNVNIKKDVNKVNYSRIEKMKLKVMFGRYVGAFQMGQFLLEAQ